MKAFFEDFVIYENYLWSICKNINILVKIDRSTGEIIKSILLEGEEIIGGHCYCHMKLIDKCIIFIPTHEEPLLILHLETEKLEYINRDQYSEWFYSVFAFHNNLIMPMIGKKEFCFLDVKTKKTKNVKLLEAINEIANPLGKNTVFWHHKCLIVNKEIYLIINTQNYFVKADMRNKTIEYLYCFDNCITDFAYFMDYFWFSLDDGEVFVLNLENLFQYNILSDTSKKYFFQYKNVLYILYEETWKLSKVFFDGVKILLQNEVEEELTNVLKKICAKDSEGLSIQVNSENEFFFQNKLGNLLKISNNDYFYSEGIEIDLLPYKKEIQHRYNNMIEQRQFGIKEMIEIIGLYEEDENCQQNYAGNIGKTIYDYRKEM